MIKKVVILHPAHWEQAMGGAELQISYLTKELVRQGYEVHFIYENKGNRIENNIGINLYPLRKVRLRKWFGQRWFLYRNQIQVKLNKIKPDVIYSRFYSSWSGFAADFAYKNKSKHIWAVASDNDLYRQYQNVSFLRPFDIIEKIYMKKVFSRTTYILTQNDFQQNTLKKFYKRNGIKVNQLAESVKEESIVKNNDQIRILWIANLKPLKRPELFIELVNHLCYSSNVELIMIGRSDEKYKQLITDCSKKCRNFNYRGEISNDEVNKELLHSHILVNTSDYEGFSNTFVQAWMRKVVVLSMNSNPDEIITKHHLGYICPTIDNLKEKIDFLINIPETLSEMGNRAYHYAIQNHSAEKNMGKIISLM